MSRQIEDLQPAVAAMCHKLIDAANAGGIPIMITQTLRTYAEQDDLYERGRTAPGHVVTNARGGESFHNFGLAFDCVFSIDHSPWISYDGPWERLGTMGEDIGLEWGGRWKHPDRPHFQLAGVPLEMARSLYGDNPVAEPEQSA